MISKASHKNREILTSKIILVSECISSKIGEGIPPKFGKSNFVFHPERVRY